MGRRQAPKYYKRSKTSGYGTKNHANRAASTIQAAIRRTLASKMETKEATYSSTDGAEILHNNFITLDSNPFKLVQGVTEGIPNTGARVGDKINLKGVSYKLMFELNERYSDVTFRIMMVRSSRGDTPTRNTLFRGESGNKMIDSFNTERYSILSTKTFKIRAPNASIGSPAEIGGVGSGIVTGNTADQLSRATKIIKMWIPGSKFTRSKGNTLTYDQGGDQVKFFDYNFIVYGYSNYSTLQDIYYVGRLNDLVRKVYYTDA